MSEFKHVGTVEILRQRIYNLDPYAQTVLATEAIVEPGFYPLMSDGLSYVWLMNGVLNGHFLRRGDGLFFAGEGNAMPTNIPISFQSKLFGEDDWAELLSHETTIEGHPDQRLRITILEDQS